MIINQIYKLDSDKMREIKAEKEKNKSIYIGEIEGSSIHYYKEYIDTVWRVFDFSTGSSRNHNAYLDWIRDLSWLDKDEYMFIIYDFNKFMDKDLTRKDMMIEDFKDIILPWWEEEIERCVVEGKAAPFNLYLVD